MAVMCMKPVAPPKTRGTTAHSGELLPLIRFLKPDGCIQKRRNWVPFHLGFIWFSYKWHFGWWQILENNLRIHKNMTVWLHIFKTPKSCWGRLISNLWKHYSNKNIGFLTPISQILFSISCYIFINKNITNTALLCFTTI